MATFTTMSKNDLIKTMKIVDELNRNFPLLTLNDIDFKGLYEQVKVPRNNILSVLALIHFLSSHNVHINIYDVKRIKVKKKNDTWQFAIQRPSDIKPLAFEFEYKII